MPVLVVSLGALIMLAGAVGMVAPKLLLEAFHGLDSPKRMAIAAGLRAVLGVIFILAAPACRVPLLLYALGGIALGAAILLVAMGPRALDAIVDWWLRQPLWALRLGMTAALLFGALVVYAGSGPDWF